MPGRSDQVLELSRFFPYRLSILQAAISGSIAEVYTGRFNLSKQEWRVIAALGATPEISAKEVAICTSMEKMPVSRAISRLVKEGLVSQQPSHTDRRASVLALTVKGLDTYNEIVPLVLEREAYLLEALSEKERETLERLMQKLLLRAHEN